MSSKKKKLPKILVSVIDTSSSDENDYSNFKGPGISPYKAKVDAAHRMNTLNMRKGHEVPSTGGHDHDELVHGDKKNKVVPSKSKHGPTEKSMIHKQKRNLKQDQGYRTVEDYSRDLLAEVGPKHWLLHMMKELDSAGPMSKHTNVALEIIRNFPVVVFSTKGNKHGRKAVQLLDETRRRHNVHENSVLELIIDDTRAGSKTYNDLVLITKSLALPQIFIDEVLIGGYDEVRALHKFKKLGRQILAAVGFDNLPCKICKKSGMNYHDHQVEY